MVTLGCGHCCPPSTEENTEACSLVQVTEMVSAAADSHIHAAPTPVSFPRTVLQQRLRHWEDGSGLCSSFLLPLLPLAGPRGWHREQGWVSISRAAEVGKEGRCSGGSRGHWVAPSPSSTTHSLTRPLTHAPASAARLSNGGWRTGLCWLCCSTMADSLFL